MFKKQYLICLFLLIGLFVGCGNNPSNNANSVKTTQETTKKVETTTRQNGAVFSLPSMPKTIVGQIAGGYVDIVNANIKDLGSNIYELTMGLDVTKYGPGKVGMGVKGTYYYYVVVLDSSNKEIIKFNVESPNMLPGSSEYGKCQFSVKFPFSETGNYKIDFLKEDFGF